MTTLDLEKVPNGLLAKIIRNDIGCWTWTGEINRNGYGRAWYLGKRQVVHRILYTLLIGDIPDGLVLDHTCRNRICCNPRHMEPVTVHENIRRGEALLFKCEGEL